MTTPTPNAADLVTLNDVKRWLAQQGNDNVGDDLLARLITSTSMEVMSFLSRNILVSNYSETFNGNGHDRHVTKNYPLIAVTGVSVNGVALTPRPSLSSPVAAIGPVTGGLFPSGYTNDDIAVYLSGYGFSRGLQNCTINYTAGYLSKALGTWATGAIAAGTLIMDSNGNTEIAIVGGAAGATQPTWPTTPGATTQDGGVTWQLGMIGLPSVVPFHLTQAVIEGIGHIYKSRDRIGLAEMMAGAQGGSTRYMTDFPAHVLRTLRLYQRSTGF